MKYTIYIIEDESDIEWIKNKLGQEVGGLCMSAASCYGYGNAGIRTFNGHFAGYGSVSFYKTEDEFKNSEFVRIGGSDSVEFDAESYDFLGLMG